VQGLRFKVQGLGFRARARRGSSERRAERRRRSEAGASGV